jgi:hypothetical protein
MTQPKPDRPPAPDDQNPLPPIQVAYSGYVHLKPIPDGRDGRLCVVEGTRDVPFEIKRVYYINGLENCVSVRGKHAHRTLRQAIFCIHGSFVLTLDDGRREQAIHMYRDHVGVLLEPGLWHTMHSFSSGCVLLVLASDFYDEADYIRDIDTWRAWIAAGGPAV